MGHVPNHLAAKSAAFFKMPLPTQNDEKLCGSIKHWVQFVKKLPDSNQSKLRFSMIGKRGLQIVFILPET